jgi:hypothetical protein
MATVSLTEDQTQKLGEFVGNLNALSHDTNLYLDPTTGNISDSTPTVLAKVVLNSDGKTYNLVLGS